MVVGGAGLLVGAEGMGDAQGKKRRSRGFLACPENLYTFVPFFFDNFYPLLSTTQ